MDQGSCSRILQPLNLLLLSVLAFNTVLGQQGVANNYTVSVRLLQYRNPESRIGSILRTPCCNIFTCDDCNNRFVFCLRPPNSAEDDLSCPLGRLESNSIRNDNIEFDNSFPSEQGGESEEKPNLFTFRGVSNRSEVQLYTIVLQDNQVLPDVLVEWFLIDFDLVRGASEVRGSQGISGVGSIVVSLSVTCSDNYYGEFCDLLCEPKNDSRRHYTCDSEGNIVCLPGFMDPLNFCNTTCPGGMCVPMESTAAIAGGWMAVVLFVAIATTLILVAVLLGRKKFDQARKRKSGVSQHEATIKGKPTKQTNNNYRGSVLGDNPTYVSGVPQTVTDLNPRTAQPGQVHRSRSNRSRTTSHKYDYIVSVRGDNEATHDQCPNELAEMESGTYSYIDERTVRRLLSSEPAPSQQKSHLPSGNRHTSAGIDISTHYEMEKSTSETHQTQTVNADISAHYETMENCVLSDTESSSNSSDHDSWNFDQSNHYEFDTS